MLCKNPFVRKSTGITRLNMVLSMDAREYGTPFPCGQCLPCKINKARVWTHRILLEQQTSSDSVFVTLTYNNEHVPTELKKDHLQKFIKRLRKNVYPKKIRYYAIGEYGEKTLRPHYHLALYNIGLHHDDCIAKAWAPRNIQLGYHYTGDLNKDSARYITGYITNKIYRDFDERLLGKQKEFMLCSKQNGGIGSKAIDQIAENLNKHASYDKQVVRNIKYGKKEMPLGGYLSRKLSEKLNNQEKMDEAYRQFQEDIYNDYMYDDKDLRYNLLKDNESKRVSQECKHKIYRKRNTI